MLLNYFATVESTTTGEALATVFQAGEENYQTYIEKNHNVTETELDYALSNVSYVDTEGDQLNFGVDIDVLKDNHSIVVMEYKIDVSSYNAHTDTYSGPIHGEITIDTEYAPVNDKDIDVKPLLDIVTSGFGGAVEKIAQRTDQVIFRGDYSDEMMAAYEEALNSNDVQKCIAFTDKLLDSFKTIDISRIHMKWHEDEPITQLNFDSI